MNGLKNLAVALSVVALAGCGQAYNPGPEEHIAGPEAKGDVFGSNPDTAPYQTVSYEVLRSMLTDLLAVTDTTNFTNTPCAGLATNSCPLLAPVSYLDANKGALGVAVYTALPGGTFPASLMTSGGFKSWILAVNSGCGLAAQNPATLERLFPAAEGGVSNYNEFYQAALGRAPSAAEIAELDMLQASFADDQHKAAAVCTTVLSSLENLAAN